MVVEKPDAQYKEEAAGSNVQGYLSRYLPPDVAYPAHLIHRLQPCQGSVDSQVTLIIPGF